MGTAPASDGPKVAYSPAEAAEALGVSQRTVRRLMASGRLRYVQLTPQVRRIPADALNELLAA